MFDLEDLKTILLKYVLGASEIFELGGIIDQNIRLYSLTFGAALKMNKNRNTAERSADRKRMKVERRSLK
ncbi:hypothetical protein OAC31_00425 [Polaribacter sp.]|nr:hypothetical protein [Polaribacter sp.]